MEENQKCTAKVLLAYLEERKKFDITSSKNNIQLLDKPFYMQDLKGEINDEDQEKYTLLDAMENPLMKRGYEIITLLGHGVQGLVALVYHTNLGSRFAIKGVKVKTKGKINEKKIGEFNNEVRMMTMCQGSPFVVNLIDSFLEDDFAFIVMQECQGTLESLLKQHHFLNEESTIKYAINIAEGIKFIHDKQCVIKDIKPDNILIDYCGNAIISDLGLAEKLEEKIKIFSKSSFVTKKMAGNLLYKAPECLASGLSEEFKKEYNITNEQLNRKSEAYSLGMIILRCINYNLNTLIFSGYSTKTRIDFSSQIEGYKLKDDFYNILNGLLNYNPTYRWEVNEALIFMKKLQIQDLKENRQFISVLEGDYSEIRNQFPNHFEVAIVRKEGNCFVPITKDIDGLILQIQNRLSSCTVDFSIPNNMTKQQLKDYALQKGNETLKILKQQFTWNNFDNIQLNKQTDEDSTGECIRGQMHLGQSKEYFQYKKKYEGDQYQKEGGKQEEDEYFGQYKEETNENQFRIVEGLYNFIQKIKKIIDN